MYFFIFLLIIYVFQEVKHFVIVFMKKSLVLKRPIKNDFI